jgi:hypothetical protein
LVRKCHHSYLCSPLSKKAGVLQKDTGLNHTLFQIILIRMNEKNLKKTFRKSWLNIKSPYLCTPFKKRVQKNEKSSLKDWKQQQRFN